ncbi:hypothetical protein FRC18_006979 [Serendipita sp. 400]|nr:hypothetical protein FRC18_006979 [Serendipita sp. 400]
MKIAFDMPTTVTTEPATSLRDTIISFTRSVLPSLPSSLYDYVPFILAGLMAILFTALLVLLVEDSEDSQPTPHSYTDAKSSQNTRDGLRRRLVTLADHSKRAGVDDEDEWDLDAWDPRADLDGTNGRNLKLSQDWIRIQADKSSGKTARSDSRLTPRRLLASPPASAPPQSQNFAPPMLSMAKLIMYRHDQSTKRSRSSSRPSPPPSPPSQGNGSFRQMQYTLKSAVIRPDKVALMVAESQRPISPPPSPIPSMEAALRALDSSRASSDSTVQTDAMTTSKSQDDLERASNLTTRRPTRHARSRSITLSLSLPSLPPSLQLLQYQDRSLRRSTSSSLEEGRASPGSESDDSTDAILADASRSQSPIREHTSPSNATANQQRGSELLVQLEEGAHTSPR